MSAARRLAAIIAANVAGYRRAMGGDGECGRASTFEDFSGARRK
jgi:hypothetical protein